MAISCSACLCVEKLLSPYHWFESNRSFACMLQLEPIFSKSFQSTSLWTISSYIPYVWLFMFSDVQSEPIETDKMQQHKKNIDHLVAVLINRKTAAKFRSLKFRPQSEKTEHMVKFDVWFILPGRGTKPHPGSLTITFCILTNFPHISFTSAPNCNQATNVHPNAPAKKRKKVEDNRQIWVSRKNRATGEGRKNDSSNMEQSHVSRTKLKCYAKWHVFLGSHQINEEKLRKKTYREYRWWNKNGWRLIATKRTTTIHFHKWKLIIYREIIMSAPSLPPLHIKIDPSPHRVAGWHVSSEFHRRKISLCLANELMNRSIHAKTQFECISKLCKQ